MIHSPTALHTETQLQQHEYDKYMRTEAHTQHSNSLHTRTDEGASWLCDLLVFR